MTYCEHIYVSTNCINCGGYLGDACENCGFLSDGGDFWASQSDIWCNCADSVSNYHYRHGWDNPNDQDGYHESKYMEPDNEERT